MSIAKKVKIRTKRRALSVRNRIKRDTLLPRVSVFRSLKHMAAQIIDDSAGVTLVGCSTLEFKDVSGDKTERATQIGVELAKRALEKGIKQVCFDRGSYLYHGRVKAFAEGMRSGGVKI
ncbi:50S ribosomal protein L18 [bacterium]|nr:50S ribosomal protein L18 [bacterium]